MARPHAQLTVDELTALVKKHRDNVPVLRELEYELGQRTRPKARTLRDEVRALLKDGSAAVPVEPAQEQQSIPPTTTPPSTNQKPLWGLPGSEQTPAMNQRLEDLKARIGVRKGPTELAATPASAVDAVPLQTGPPASSTWREPHPLPKPNAVAEMSVESARRILGAERATPWEKLEATRREKVQKAHPDGLRGLAPPMAQALVDEAARVNAAYACLMAERAQA